MWSQPLKEFTVWLKEPPRPCLPWEPHSSLCPFSWAMPSWATPFLPKVAHAVASGNSQFPPHCPLWLDKTLQDSAWCHFPRKPSLSLSLGEGPMALRPYSYQWIYHMEASLCISKLVLEGQDSTSSPLEWLVQIWGSWNLTNHLESIMDIIIFFMFS